MSRKIDDHGIIACAIYVCTDCYNLKGEMCNNPYCVFCRRTMTEVGEYLDVLLIRPVVNGVREKF